MNAAGKFVTVVGATIIGLGILGSMESATPKTAAEIAAEREASAKKAARFEALSLCHNSVRQSAIYPSKADFYALAHYEREIALDAGYWLIGGKADFMNGFGAMVPHDFRCLISIDGATMVSLEVTPEG